MISIGYTVFLAFSILFGASTAGKNHINNKYAEGCKNSEYVVNEQEGYATCKDGTKINWNADF